ncbi:SRPBCC family protein [Paracoccus pacificus]|uniref:SRPBCC family protein n=1 Tax=Paracoccus pacificus TaxID=1463598 RepID=A0ABW4RB76_9RHOB
MTGQNQNRTEGNDLIISRRIAAPPSRIWHAWTEPEQLRQWFAPKPVEVTDCTIDARPGGACNVTMRLPDGTEMRNPGCVLVAEVDHKLVFTDALGAGFRPAGAGFMTAVILMEPDGDGTMYSARVLHATVEDRERHEDMGFFQGWGQCLDQLAALVET